MGAVGLNTWPHPGLQEPLGHSVEIMPLEHRNALPLDVLYQRSGTPDDAYWHWRLCNAGTDKNDDIVNLVSIDAEQLLNRFDVLVVLSNGVLKFRLLAKYDLGPLCPIGVPEDPARHIFRFYDENSKP